MRALVIGDDDTTRLRVIGRLAADGFDVHHAPSSDAALHFLALHPDLDPFDLLVVDLDSAGRSALEVARILGTPAVMIATIASDPGMVDQIHRAGAHVLLRPFALDRLSELAREVA